MTERPTTDAPLSRPAPPVEAVLFDMGGVMIELGPLDELLGVAMPAEEFWPRWLASPSVRAFERGACDEHAFAAGLVAELSLPISAAEVVTRFERFPRGLFPGAADLVRSLRPDVVTGVLSNTNRLHWEGQPDAVELASLFDHRFLSYEMGLVKPDPEIFERVVDLLGVAAGAVLFLDDNLINVESARRVGLDAEVTAGVGPAREALAARGLLTVSGAG